MERLTNVKIVSVSKKKEGTSVKDGKEFDWILYNFTIDDEDWEDTWFSYFQSGRKPTPVKGMDLDLLGFEVDDEGKYTNYNVKKLFVKEEKQKPKPKPKQKNGNGNSNPLSMYVSYAKDLQIARIKQMNPEDIGQFTLKELAQEVAVCGLLMKNNAETGETWELPERKNIDDDADIPF